MMPSTGPTNAQLTEKVEKIRSTLATFADFPKKGILFYDIMPLLRDPAVFQITIDVLSAKIKAAGPVDTILALESRGFLFGPTLALQHNLPFVPIRKKNKLPGPTKSISYSLEYGEDTIEVQDGSIEPGCRAVIIDDLLATGGTLRAAVNLVKACGGQVVSSLVIIELVDLKSRDKIGSPFDSIIQV